MTTTEKPVDPQPASSDDVERIWDVMDSERTAFLVTQTQAGPHARPMSAIVRAEEGLVWFLTDRSTIKDKEIESDSRCAMVFTDASSTHVAVTGTAEVIDDRAIVKDLWSVSAQAFFPGGPEDEAILAIRVTPRIAELWDGPSTPVAIVKMAAALITGNSAADIGNNVEARLD